MMRKSIYALFPILIFVLVIFQNCGGFTPGAVSSDLSSSQGEGGTPTGTVGTGSGAVQLNWAAPRLGTATGYNIELSTDGTSFTQVQQAAAGVTSAQITGLATGTYYFRVRAYNTAGVSSATTVVTAVVK